MDGVQSDARLSVGTSPQPLSGRSRLRLDGEGLIKTRCVLQTKPVAPVFSQMEHPRLRD